MVAFPVNNTYSVCETFFVLIIEISSATELH